MADNVIINTKLYIPFLLNGIILFMPLFCKKQFWLYWKHCFPLASFFDIYVLCYLSVLPRGKLLETRPPCKFSDGGASKWTRRAEPHIPAPPSLWSGPSSIPCVPSSCSPAYHTPPLSQRLLFLKVWWSSLQTCEPEETLFTAAQKLQALSAP